MYPLTFEPRFKERVWGGRRLESLYGKPLPAGKPVGESWEVTDREGDVSVIGNGPWAGKDLRWLMEKHREELLGEAAAQGERFPLLVKILDARDKLSLQVHPPAHAAGKLNGEPKTEMWYITATDPGAELYVGLKRGVTRETFETKVKDGTVAECFHRVPVRPGDAMFLPSGRVHAIGAGNVMFEIQQNSDTTYRVFDWNRKGLDGKPRELHIEESLASIDFEDFEPPLVEPEPVFEQAGVRGSRLVATELFDVFLCEMEAGARWPLDAEPRCRLIGLVQGRVETKAGGQQAGLDAGQFCLLPAALEEPVIEAPVAARFLLTRPARVRQERGRQGGGPS